MLDKNRSDFSGNDLPCPGMSEPESLTPASRLIIDSVKSPKTDPKKLRTPNAIVLFKKEQLRIITT